MLIFMNNLLIKIYCNDIDTLIKITFYYHIKLYNIKIYKDFIICNIIKDDLENIKKIYKIDILNDSTFKNLLIKIKNNINNIIFFILGSILFIFLSNVIVNVNIQSNNKELVKELTKILDQYDIKRLTLKKDFIKIKEIKEKILNDYKDKLEWLEIESIGMTYNIKLEERKKENNNISEGKCNVIASSDGMISKIISNKGIVMAKNNQIVHENDILITGHITLNEEEKADVCASGKVYAEKWYNVSIEIPTTYLKKRYTGKKRNNIIIEYDNRDYKIFKSRLKKYDSDYNEIISLLGKKIILVKEYEYVEDILEYSDEELEKKINDMVTEKLNLSLKEDEKILQKNTLKKEVNDSKINIELFVTVEKLISKQVTY